MVFKYSLKDKIHYKHTHFEEKDVPRGTCWVKAAGSSSLIKDMTAAPRFYFSSIQQDFV